MEDITLYTAYYSHYHVRAAEAAAVPSVSRKRQGIICTCLAFGAACGMATVGVGFFSHQPAITWPVVAFGLVGVIIGLTLAHRNATGGWLWKGTPSSGLNAPEVSSSGTAHLAANNVQAASGRMGGSGGGSGGGPGGWYHLPMYYADALDVELGIVQTPYSLLVRLSTDKMAQVQKGQDAAVDNGESCMGTPGTQAMKAQDGMLSPLSAAAAVVPTVSAAEYGTVMCGFPLPGADGWIDTRPVLVLQPHTQVVLQPPSRPPTEQQQAEPLQNCTTFTVEEAPGTVVGSMENAAVVASAAVSPPLMPGDTQKPEAAATPSASTATTAATTAAKNLIPDALQSVPPIASSPQQIEQGP